MAISNPQKWVEIFRLFFSYCHLSKKELSDKESWMPGKCVNSKGASVPFLRQLMMRDCSPCPSCEGMVPELGERLAPKTSFSISFQIIHFYNFCRPHSEKWKDKSCIWKPHRVTIYQKKKKDFLPKMASYCMRFSRLTIPLTGFSISLKKFTVKNIWGEWHLIFFSNRSYKEQCFLSNIDT